MTTKVVVRHFHEGNDADRAVRAQAVYATQARIVDLDTGCTVESLKEEPNGVGAIEVLAEVWAYCNSKDIPSRKQGRAIVLGRLQKQFPEECAKADFGVFKDFKVGGA